MANQGLKILLADSNMTTSRRLQAYLQESGFDVHLVNDGMLAAEHILEFRPNFILIDLTLPNFTAFQCLDFLKEKGLLQNEQTKVFVLSQHNAKQNVEACLRMGAHDYLVKPLNPIDVLSRLALQLQAKNSPTKLTAGQESQQANYYLQLAELFIKTLMVPTSSHQVHFQLLRMLSMAVSAVRINLIRIDEKATVIASSDNEKFNRFELNMEKYPEIAYVQRTQKPLFIESLKDDSSMAFIKEHVKTVHFNTMIVLPVIDMDNNIMGILSTRLSESSKLTDADIRLCRVMSQLISAYWVNRRGNSLKQAA